MSGTTALLCLELLGRIECDPQQCLKVCECMWYVWCVLMFIVSLYRCVSSR